MLMNATAAAANTTASGGQSGRDGQRIADDFDTFLQLLTTQLRNQNPLDPLDTHQFTQQLVQFAGVEQQIAQNSKLEDMIQLSAANTATAAAGFIGRNVTVESARTGLADGSAEWSYISASEAPEADFTIRDETGAIVWTERRSLEPGRDTYRWNGRMNDGGTAPDGEYSLTIDARSPDGDTVRVRTEVAAMIDGIDFSGREPMLLAAGREIPLSQLRTVTGN